MKKSKIFALTTFSLTVTFIVFKNLKERYEYINSNIYCKTKNPLFLSRGFSKERERINEKLR